jgi:hypothetical protein
MENDLKNCYNSKIELERKQSEIIDQIKRKLFFQFVSKIKLQNDLNEINQKLINVNKVFISSVRKFQFLNDKNFSNLVIENKKLLFKNEFKIKTFQKGAIDGYTEKEFKGKITANGFLYLFTVDLNLNSTYSLQDNNMSSFFKGNFDELGNYNAKSLDSEFYMMIPRIPETFKARGFEDGSFTMIADQKEWDLTGQEYVKKMVGDPFNSVNYDRNKFLKNRILIDENVSDFITNFMK